MKIAHLDKLLIGFFGIFLIIGLYFLLFQESEKPKQISPSKKIGEISEIKNNVKKKNSFSLIWHESSKGDPIVENDFIFTGDDSEVQIMLINGNIINISNNSMIHFLNYQDFPSINLKKGELASNGESPIKINFPESKKEIFSKGSNFKVSQGTKNIELSVFKGNVLFNNSQKINQGNKLILKDGKKQIAKISLYIKKVEHNKETSTIYLVNKTSSSEILINLYKTKGKTPTESIKSTVDKVDIPKDYKYISLSSGDIRTPLYPIIKYGQKISLIKKKKPSTRKDYTTSFFDILKNEIEKMKGKNKLKKEISKSPKD